ncbi:ABC transporter ATP-binding protein [Roseomonas nepalensis]|uniref:ABC transporter ATP-binding protein n=1 Tax=Muricoccus nepalensis TaxID=1854500 RepID=A0A502G841_9PROT|nr:ABC transporter ATP-binding protein [Roseomonas nepalensis]TPG57782.1 ABC transporter ATP-binding protein [Roseomonas nepalensis]
MTIHAADFRELRLEGMRRAFGTVNALKGIDLRIARGEFIALLGPSGCGKSTALNCLAGLLPLTGGSIWLDDQRIDTRRPEQRGFGMVFQNYALFPHMSVRRNVAFGLLMRGVPKAEAARRVEEALATVRLQAQADKLPGQLSGGQQQRVAIARAIAIEPPVVLMDEPLSNLDAKLRLEMRAEIRRIHEGLGSTTIYVTHDQEEALSLADRIVVMREGEIRQVGTPEELYAQPAHLDVADFMGYRNRLPGRIAGREGGLVTLDMGQGGRLTGTMREPLGETAVIAVRPDDMTTTDENASGVPATVRAIEYRGREFHGIATTSEGIDLFFHTERPVQVGTLVRLAAEPQRALVFAGEAA